MTRVNRSRHSTLKGTIWLPDGGLLVYGYGGIVVYDVQPAATCDPRATPAPR